MDVFLSYNRRDVAHAAALNDWLGGQGVRTFFDQRDLGAGQLWLPDLEHRIEQDVQAVAVLVGPAGLGNTQQYEHQLALTRQSGDPGFPVIPVILPGTPDWRVPRGFLGLQTWVSFAAATETRQNPAGLQRLLAAIRREPADADSVRGTICPYKGLAFFDEGDSAMFFGRDSEAGALLETVTRHRVAALIGRSGSGKSSMVRAGLLPLLRRRADTVWDSLIIRPGEEPLLALADALSPLRPDEDPLDRRRRLVTQAAALRQDAPDILAGTLRDRLGTARLRVDRLLIVVDQAEELFSQPWRLTDAEAIRQFHADAEQFMHLLLEAAAQGPASLVLTIRSDFFDPLMHSPFAPLLKEAQVPLGRIADLRPCVERPAAVVGLRFAPGLVDRIVDEVGPEESNLPLLQHALERTWQQPRHGAVLTADAYVAAGGVAHAINRAATDCYATLSPDECDAARRLFLRLVRPGQGSAHTRVRALVPDDPAERQVMDLFAHPDRRLLFVGEQAGLPVVEVAHETLVRGWETLRAWVEESREKLRVRDAVTDWRASAGEGELIPPGTALLQRARDLLADPGDVRLDADIAAYMRRSIEAQDAAVRATQRRRRRLFAALAVAAVFFAGLSAAAGWSWWQSAVQTHIANEQHAIAEQQKTMAEAQRARAETSAKVAQSAAQGVIFEIAQGLADQQGIAAGTVRHILDTALGVIDAMLGYSPDDAALRRLKWAALSEFADTYARLGDTGKQQEMAEQALDIAAAAAAEAPDDPDRQRDLSGNHGRLGDVLVAQGNLPGALEAYRKDLAIMETLAARDPGNTQWQRDLSGSNVTLGDVLVAQGDLPAALEAYRKGLATMEPLAARDPGNTQWQRDLYVTNVKLGDVLVAQGDLPGALDAYHKDLAIMEPLAARDPGNARWQRDLSISHDRLGDVLRAQGNLPGALEAHRKGLAIRETLAARDPGNTQWRRDELVSHNKLGDVLKAQGDLPGALEAYRKSLASMETLATRDQGNTDWQRDVSIGLGRVADTLLRLDRNTEARPLAERALTLRRTAITRFPDDPRLASGLPYYEDLLRRAGGTP